jgi:Ran GTPase-activating protein (RanGAP) involved in mRNA processing and transport
MDKMDARMLKYCLEHADSKSTLKSLILSNNDFSKDAVKPLTNLKISEIDLSNCKIGVAGANSISKALQINFDLKHLNLYNNNMKVEGARAIAKGLEENKTLELLDIGSNLIRNKGFEALKSCLGTSLRLLAAKNNAIKDKGFNHFMDAYHEHGVNKLRTLLLAGNDINMYTVKLTVEDLADRMYLDLSLKLENHNDKTLFLCGLNPKNTKPLLKKYFDKHKCGIIEQIDIIKGREKVKGKQNIFGFVKFAHKNGKMRIVGKLEDIEGKVIKF